ncbi:hypothetical protein NE237_023043 [Protea cynaroides]|uniref:Protein kinase domain-containing protein n=1 Tax=Protea cynaroides TaxID=273540 RepID=A0A9Q0HC69_9MAGN|nr:hypothetical protein NE237_023043 [Protea cynaroides]
MDGEDNPLAPPATSQKFSLLYRPFSSSSSSTSSSSSSSTSSSSSSSTSFSSSTPDFVRDVQAALKRHRPLGTMQCESLRPRRVLVPQREPKKGNDESQDTVSSRQANAAHDLIAERQNVISVAGECPDDSSITPPSFTATVTQTHDQNLEPFGVKRDKTKLDLDGRNDDGVSSSCVVSQHLPAVDGPKKVQISLGSNVDPQKMERIGRNRLETSTVNDHELKQQEIQQPEVLDVSLGSDVGISSLLAKRNALYQDQQHQLMAFNGKDSSHPMIQSSLVGSTCVTRTSVHSSISPMPNSMNTSCLQDSGSLMDIEPQPTAQVDAVPPCSTFQSSSGTVIDQKAFPNQASVFSFNPTLGIDDHGPLRVQQDCNMKECKQPHDAHVGHGKGPQFDDKPKKGKEFPGDGPDGISQVPSTRNSYSNVKLKSENPEKALSGKGASVRKKNYDADLFFKVNGKLYQKLGKIGSGGSSEVYKVISADCTIYALKKIKLKGRDYATAYGFSQEIEYLNKLKGKNNIIQLVDFEVTDKTLLNDVMNGSMNTKDGRIKDDGYIYMVLEFGEIDLAHMLSQKWKEMDSSEWSIDENWLRFYWQQILQAVNTIHEERIVHSDLKPANFLLIKGSLKLIDFGIAKAIMSDTTNIQRDSQVGTLSYMSPEAFMCSENDANGNTIKCGRPSDIWSLGCILYQMVYGKTPFAEYKTFWAKFKVITDRNHEITYGPVSNPLLLDLMKKCLAWDRNERWRIPQLLQHPFLVPPVSSQLSLPQYQSCKLLQLMADAYGNDHEMSSLLSQLQQILTDPVPLLTSQLYTSQDQHFELLSQMSRLCYQLRQHIASLGEE